MGARPAGVPDDLHTLFELRYFPLARLDENLTDWGGERRQMDQPRTRSIYSPSLVSIRIFSPVLMKGGT